MRNGIVGLLGFAALCFATPGSAQEPRHLPLPAPDGILAYATVMDDTSVPMGWVGFCGENPGECRAQRLREADIPHTAQAWRVIVAINNRVNRTIAPLTDEAHWGVTERWNYPDDGRGDCEDYALLKRRLLIEAGFPRQALLMTVVRDNRGEGHAVLTAVTNRGDFILDNKQDAILPWRATGYNFLKRQSRDNQNRWVAIGEPSQATETAAR